MSVILKDDWVSVGNNPRSKRDADWRNAVSNLLNMANVPSGGTAELTTTGLQIEIDGDDNAPYHFEVINGDTGEVEVRGGYGILTNGGAGFVKAPLKDGATDKVTIDTFVTFDMTSESGDVEIWAVLTPPVSATPAFITLIKSGEYSEGDYMVVATVSASSGEVTAISQHWNGGYIPFSLPIQNEWEIGIGANEFESDADPSFTTIPPLDAFAVYQSRLMVIDGWLTHRSLQICIDPEDGV